MIDLRCFNIADGGSSWIVRCRRCAAGWLRTKDGDVEPHAIIEHAMTHQVRLTRAEELTRRVRAVRGALADVERDLAGPTASGRRESLLCERAVYASWLALLLRRNVPPAPARDDATSARS